MSGSINRIICINCITQDCSLPVNMLIELLQWMRSVQLLLTEIQILIKICFLCPAQRQHVINDDLVSWVQQYHAICFSLLLNSFTLAARVNWSPRAQRSCSCSSRSIGNQCSPSSQRRSLQTSPGNPLYTRQAQDKLLGPWLRFTLLDFCCPWEKSNVSSCSCWSSCVVAAFYLAVTVLRTT